MTLEIKNPWWKWMPIDKMAALLEEAKGAGRGAVYATPSQVREIALLDKEFSLVGIISVGAEEIEWFDDGDGALTKKSK